MSSDLTASGTGDPLGAHDVSSGSAPSAAAVALSSAAISGVLTGIVALVLAFPAACDARLAPFMTDCRNVLGWSSFAEYPGSALLMGAGAGLAAALLVFLTMRFSDS